MKNFVGVFTGLVMALSATAVSAADLALIVAQERFDHLPRLRGASSEANALERAYRDDGFGVAVVRDGTSAQIRDALAQFEANSDDMDRLVIHFVGRFVQSKQNSRFAAKDHRLESVVDAHYTSPSLDLVYELLGKRPGRAALVIDTPNPILPLLLAQGPEIAQGVLVIAGPYRETSKLVREDLLAGDVPPATISEKQSKVLLTGFVNDQPFEAASTGIADFSNPAPQTNTNTNNNSAFAEMTAWRTAANDGSKEALERYLTAYPKGLFAGEANARLAALVPPEERAEAALNLSRNERREIQRNLTLLGFNTRGVDGIFGRGSRQAIAAWQKSERFRQSGFLDGAQVRVLKASAAARQQEMDRQAEQEKADRDAADLAFWQRTGATGREDGLRAYLSEFPEGLFASQATRALASIQEQSGVRANAQAEAVEARLGLNSRTRLLVEQRLAGLKLNPGQVDGQFDGNSRRAIAAFQQRIGLDATGYLTNETVGQLIASVFR